MKVPKAIITLLCCLACCTGLASENLRVLQTGILKQERGPAKTRLVLARLKEKLQIR